MDDPNKPRKNERAMESANKKVKQIAREKLKLLVKLQGKPEALVVLLSKLDPIILFALMRMAEKDRVFVAYKNLWMRVATQYFVDRTDKSCRYFEEVLTNAGLGEPFNYFHMILCCDLIKTVLYQDLFTNRTFHSADEIIESGISFASGYVEFSVFPDYEEEILVTARLRSDHDQLRLYVSNNKNNNTPEFINLIGDALKHAFKRVGPPNKGKLWTGLSADGFFILGASKKFETLFVLLYSILNMQKEDLKIFVRLVFNEGTSVASRVKINKQALF